MTILRAIVALLITCCVTTSSAVASKSPNREDAVALVKEAKQFLKKNGRGIALAEFSKPMGRFAHGELYVVALDFDGVVLAHGGNARLIGKRILDIKDPDGKRFVLDHINVAKSPGSGWVYFRWPNPRSNKIAPKVVWVEVADDIILAAGVYLNQ